MRRRTLMTTLAVSLTLAALAAAGAGPASAALSYSPCPENTGFSCAAISVPLDRSGKAPGTIALTIERKAVGATQTPSAVIALAGGPGQAADPLAEQLATAIAPALSTHDLLVFDQRGTGRSSPLNCPVFDNTAALESAGEAALGSLVELCALQIGAARGAFTTQESVEDIEAIRHQAGYKKLVLYGTSYGTKVALEYAERYPQHVEALVLDSVVQTTGPEAFGVDRLQAITPVMNELCSDHACAGITSDPVGDLARLIAKLRKRPISGSAFDGAGKRHSVSLGELDLLNILEAGDLNPALRALLPAAVHSALNGDPDPLLRLNLITDGLVPSVPIKPDPEAEKVSKEEENNALFVATSCEETLFPWQRSANATTRLGEANAALKALPSTDFYPFDAEAALADSLVPICASWPDASAAPPAQTALPNVPTLILSGEQDLRTPTSGAKALAALIPDAQLLTVPYTGHSVLGSDFSGCAQTAVGAFFAGTPVQPCSAATQNVFAPTPVAPRKLAYVKAPSGLSGKPGRTLTAVLDAIVDLDRQVVAATLQAEQELPSGASFGGLRGGYARLTSTAATMKGFSFVNGVALNGTFPVKNHELQPATIRISGTTAAAGMVRLSADKRVSGTLGGKRFNVSLAKVKLSSAGGAGEWPLRPLKLPLAGLAHESPLAAR
ncbi:MAG TPA: alpha/beta hydrolase [Solirubrobacteraceae bacterium]|jgi:pimeloyl-ACP methyl ester carboxylesterase|nr:alpha/beta hydrolase [Solirubrobacteraceae bacterium]